MEFLGQVLNDAWGALIDFGPDLRGVIMLTLLVSGIATILGVVIGVPLGTALGLQRFPGSRLLTTAVNVGMGVPPVLVGLLFLILFWNTGPLGSLGLVFTPAAMVLAQVALAVPVAAGVTRGAIQGLAPEAFEQMQALKLDLPTKSRLAIVEAGSGVGAAVVAAFGRVISEVGAVLIVGGNILGETRVLTTLIVQESRQAQFGLAIAAGVVLLVISLAVNLMLARMTRIRLVTL